MAVVSRGNNVSLAVGVLYECIMFTLLRFSEGVNENVLDVIILQFLDRFIGRHV